MASPQKGRIFISYRRTDSAGYAGRIYDRLTAHFGAEAVFMDVDTIEAGVDFIKVLQNAVQSCDALLVLIGRQWLTAKDYEGRRRLDSPEDFVRVEIAAALSRDIRVIPILVDGVTMPRSSELPENLKALARRNALQLNHHSFNTDANRLIAQLELALQTAEKARVEKAQREKEARERQASEEQAQKDREDQEHRKAKEKDRKDREMREKKVARQSQFIDLKNRTADWIRAYRRTFGIAFIVIIGIVGLIIGGKYLANAIPVSSEPTLTQTLPLVSSFTPESLPVATDSSESTSATLASATLISTIAPPKNPSIGKTWLQTIDGMVMVYVPAGEFVMGSENGDDDEKPVHSVYLDAFWIDRTEVTNAMYAQCVYSGECEIPTRNSSFTRASYYGNSTFDDYPVVYVSWNQAKAYCDWAGRRLLSEAEWEKAASWDEDAQFQRVYSWGNHFDGTKTNFCDAKCSISHRNENFNDGYADTAPVSSYPTGGSFYGAYDMVGNVAEWVTDWYESGYYNNAPESNPTGPSSGEYRVLRGGSCLMTMRFLRTSDRVSIIPSYTNNYIGFRCARDAAP